MIYWAPLLHFYQPPTQSASVLRRIADECYRPLVKLFREYPGAHATFNVSASLTEMLADQGGEDVIAGLRELAERGQIEFVGSAKYHPILPLIPRDEVRRQIALNYQTNRTHIGEVYAPRGFFPPEMCYGAEIVEPILETGHHWLVVAGLACPVAWPLDVVHRVCSELGDLHVLFRDDVLSNEVSFRTVDAATFVARLTALRGDRPSAYVVTAMDAETFGHHIAGWDRTFLGRVFDGLADASLVASTPPLRAPALPGRDGAADRAATRRRQIAAVASSPAVRELIGVATAERDGHAPTTELAAPEVVYLHGEPPAEHLDGHHPASTRAAVRTVRISELPGLFPAGQAISPRASSWSTSAADLASGVPYPLWRHPGNAIHDLQWQLLDLCIELVRKAQAVADTDHSRHHARIARALLDRALHSCQFWWASRRPMWDINMINRGTLAQYEVLLNAHKAIASSGADAEDKTRSYYKVIVARDIAGKITDHLFVD